MHRKLIATYARVSTARQEEEGSIETQLAAVRDFARQHGYTIVKEYVDDGWTDAPDPPSSACWMKAPAPTAASTTSAFSLFYRGEEMELTIPKPRKHGVDVVSVTQPTGDEPPQENTSRESGKNVTRGMRESTKQSFWNGTIPPLAIASSRASAEARQGQEAPRN